MKARALLAAALLLAGLFPRAAAGGLLMREDFASLAAWRPLTFPKIERHSVYAVETDAEGTRLRAESDASASGLVWRKEFDVYAHPRLRWRWKVANVYEKGDSRRKSGDDYPIRLYVMFRYDPEGAGAGKRFKYGAAKLLYGEYPPDSSISYVWDSRTSAAEFVASPYTDAMYMFLKQKGKEKVGEWVEEEADVLADYRRAFGRDPPRMASLAVMNDSDNTGERSLSWLAWVEIAQ